MLYIIPKMFMEKLDYQKIRFWVEVVVMVT